jgi:hypothetical protein
VGKFLVNSNLKSAERSLETKIRPQPGKPFAVNWPKIKKKVGVF